MYLCPFEDAAVAHFNPLTLTRAVYDLRLGIRTLLETQRDAFNDPQLLLHARHTVAGVTGQEHDVLTNRVPDGLDVLFLNGRYVAEEGPLLDRLRAATRGGEPGRVFVQGEDVIGAWVPNASNRLVASDAITRETFEGLPEEQVEGARLIGRLWHLMDELVPALHRDYDALTSGYNIYERPGVTVQPGAVMVDGEHIYIAPGVTVRAGAILSAEGGPIYIDRDCHIRENAILRGPLYVGPHSEIKTVADVEASAFGPGCKVNGEVHESVFHSYTNKAHSGYLGNAYLGRWCNLGADTNNSNLKNDYGIVSMYDPATGQYESTGRQFAGLIMGDHSKCGINTMFNTGTVIGVFCNLYGSDFPPRYLPSFSWGSPRDGFSEYRLDKALAVAEAVMARREIPLTDADREMLTAVFEASRAERVGQVA
ncbi:MAG TPA: putative sugar nucleotidyl transferase [Rhodothermales bacterium]|nr:putative sugar nucleotidyl transferase [Rhodothermales bacterium]